MVNGAGIVSSANTGYSIGRHVAYAYLPPELARPGHPLASAEVGAVGNERAADAAGAGIELAHAAGDEIDQNVGVTNLLDGFFAEFSVHNIFPNFVRVTIATAHREAT